MAHEHDTYKGSYTGAQVDSAVAAHEGYLSQEVELGGDFTAGEKIMLTKYKDRVIITGLTASLAHTSSATPISATGVIPADFRPTNQVAFPSVLSLNSGTITIAQVDINASGTFSITYIVTDGTTTARTSSGYVPNLAYNITSS